MSGRRANFCLLTVVVSVWVLHGDLTVSRASAQSPSGGPAAEQRMREDSAPSVAQADADDRAPTSEARAEYKQAVDEAIEEFDAGRFAEARALFLRAHAVWPSARTLRTLGMTAFELGMYPQALQELQAALDDPRRALEGKPRRQVAALLEKTRAYVGKYRIHVTPLDAELQVDGTPVPVDAEGVLALAVGYHELRVRAAGHHELWRTVFVQGREEELTLRLEELAPAAPNPAPARVLEPEPAPRRVNVAPQHVDARDDVRRPLALVAFSVGAAGAVVGAVMLGLALDRRKTVEDDSHCPDEVCPPAYASELSQLRQFANGATAGAVIAGVGFGTGLALWLTQRRGRAHAAHARSFEPRLGLGSASVAGSF